MEEIYSLFLGISSRALGEFDNARRFLLLTANGSGNISGTWMVSMAHYEVAVLSMREAQSIENQSPNDTSSKSKWATAISEATKHLDEAAARLGETDLSSRLESRIAMVSVRNSSVSQRISLTSRRQYSCGTRSNRKRPRYNYFIK